MLSESLLMGLRLLHRQLSLQSQETTTYTLCLYVHEGKLVAILKDQKLFLMGNIESAELETQLCGSEGDVISPISQCSLSTHCVQGIRSPGSVGRLQGDAQHTFLNDICSVSVDSLRNLRSS